MTDLPSDFPRDLREALGLDQPAATPLPRLAPITDKIRQALAEAHRTKGKCI